MARSALPESPVYLARLTADLHQFYIWDANFPGKRFVKLRFINETSKNLGFTILSYF